MADPRSPGLLGAGIHQLRLFFIALQFFTRVPIPRWVGFEPEWLHHASRYFAVVGIVVGTVTATIYALAALVFPPVVAVLLSTIAGIYLTGAFHEDGFADTCDGLGGGMSKARVLEIMTDSRIGAYGAIGIGLLLALKIAALASMPTQLATIALFVAHPLSRLVSTALIWRLDYVKGEGKAKPLAQKMTTVEFMIAAATVLVPIFFACVVSGLSWKAALVSVAASALAASWLARKFVTRIGGYTGDCLGAVQQVSEVAVYLSILAVGN